MLFFNFLSANQESHEICNSSFSESRSSDPRELMKQNLPDWIQPFLTNITAKPFIGEEPHYEKITHSIVKTFAVLIVGISISFIAFYCSGLFLSFISVGWILTVHSVRKLRLTILHACSHHTVFANRKYNAWLGESISILTLTLNFKDYQQGHTKTHHSDKLLTPGEETFDYLIEVVGFKRGMTAHEAWHHLWITLFSPTFHIYRFASRLTATFLSNSLNHNLLSFTFWLGVLGVITITNSWLAFLVAWVIPISFLFEASSLLRQCVEHRFSTSTTAEITPELLSQMTLAIFCGESPPKLNPDALWSEQFLAWTYWWLRMLFYHLPSRILVLTGDSPCHDWHHRNIGSRKWIACIFERQKSVDAGVEYQHRWGLLEAIDETFKSFY